MTKLIIPCFNESQRLQWEAFGQAAGQDLQLLFVDDGSRDGTGELLKENFAGHPFIEILILPKNTGKAEAVRQGMLHALSQLQKPEWLGFWDADLATPLSEVKNFLSYRDALYPESKAIWGSRVYRLGAKIRRSAKRHYLGRVFATLIAEILEITAYDTQCGAKLFKSETAQKVFAEKFLSRWIFDVEILLRMNQIDVIEYPVKEWQDIPGSKVKILKEGFRVFFEIFKLKKRYKSN